MENLTYLQKQIERISKEVRKMCHQKPWAESMTYLMQLPGFGVITAMTVLSAIGDIQRFETPKHLASYSGLTPGLEQSGTKNRGKGITKAGRRELRWALVEAAQMAVKSDPLWKRRFQEMQKRMHRNQAIVAVARRLLELVWYVLTRRQPYRHFNQERIAYKYLTWSWQMDEVARDGLTRQQFARYYLMRLGIGHDGLARAHATNYPDTAGPIYLHARAAIAPPAPGAGDPMRVVTFNIEYALRIDGALELLRDEPSLRAPDILCLQEMDTLGTQRIARALGMNYVYAPSGVHPKHKRDFGCANLSPWPLVNPRKILLPHGARVTGLRRAAVSATVVRGGRRMLVYSLHLPSPLGISGGSRRDQVRTLAADVDSMIEAANRAEGDSASERVDAVILAGDFNSKGVCEELVEAGFAW